ncbi:ATP-binding cassette domain-containing protein [Brachybacterium saurashtrense]|uniref:ABC transporter ATP-binding protein n=1 Tax=Brachybacterium saurashtrense TaxID=556288 RepID=A0A345YKD2_9MICO|nr:ABC transporter ATP-binding protein [Brachybacterium saurashtrense]AXK44384.1 ABC transporter ATP-binding protein [Brachybacterium saurashtrense]RRR22995.1 ABC transporter ATP-binding protein [Brachybacterium saurashtrense]
MSTLQSTPAAVSVRGLDVHLPDPRRRTRPSCRVLRDDSFEVPRGQVTALVGTNGAGKTTLLRTLSGAYAPSTGDIAVEGVPLGGAEDALPAGVGVVPDSPFQPAHWTADDLVLAQCAVEPEYDARLVGRLLRRAGIAPSAPLRRLSAGQRSRLLVAVALGMHPTLLLLDEPFAHLDPLARTEVVEELREHLADGADRTILLSTHDLGGMDRFVDHIVLLHDGRVVLEGGALDLIEDHLMATVEAAASHTAELRGARRSGDRLEGLMRAEDAVGLPSIVDLRRPTLQDVLTFTLREASR